MTPAQRVWLRLLAIKLNRNPDPFTDSDRETFQKTIDSRLSDGWTEDEIVNYLRYCEEIDNTTPEGLCLARMGTVFREVQRRLDATSKEY